jgi:hypothetical protein
MSSDSHTFKAVVSVSVATGLLVTLGIAKAILGVHLLLASTVLGAAIGPAPMIVRSAFDLAIGLAFAVAALAFAWRKEWGLSFIRRFWISWAAYELGLLLGRSVERLMFGPTVDASLAFGFVIAVVVAGLFAEASTSDDFVASSGKAP